MINNNFFFLNDFQNVVIIGETPIIKKIIKINNEINVKTVLITSKDQSKLIDNNIKYKVFNKLNQSFKKYILKEVEPEKSLFVSMGSRIIFNKNDIRNFFKENIINFHGTRLPLDAGAGTWSWKIMREDRIDTQLAHVIDEGIDTGGIIDYKLHICPPYCRTPADFEKFRLIKFELFYKNLVNNIKKKKKFFLKNQINFAGRYNPRLNTKENGYINWSLNSHDLYNFINAFDDPYDGATTFLNNGNFGKLNIKSVHLHAGDSSNHPFMAGLVTRHDKDWLVVGTNGKHMLLIEKILDRKGTNIISKIKKGDRFFTPSKNLDNAISKRVKVGSLGFKKSKKN